MSRPLIKINKCALPLRALMTYGSLKKTQTPMKMRFFRIFGAGKKGALQRFAL